MALNLGGNEMLITCYLIFFLSFWVSSVNCKAFDNVPVIQDGHHLQTNTCHLKRQPMTMPVLISELLWRNKVYLLDKIQEENCHNQVSEKGQASSASRFRPTFFFYIANCLCCSDLTLTWCKSFLTEKSDSFRVLLKYLNGEFVTQHVFSQTACSLGSSVLVKKWL